jgi:hypothetical protein
MLTYERETATVAAADRGRNRRDVLLIHPSLLHMTTQEIIAMMTPKSKRRDVTLRHDIPQVHGIVCSLFDK